MHNEQNGLKGDYQGYVIEKIGKEDYPGLLREITDPPKALYIKRGWKTARPYYSMAPKHLCIVGSRRNSVYGKEVCERLIRGLAGYPITIVSGLAFGIDAIAHQAALSANLKTIAIPGSGLHQSVLYPRTHLGLATSILASGGDLISEYEPEFQSAPWTFPRRNRIMAGISDAILIIEAEEKSGTLITARLALDYNREILAVPGSIFSQNTAGVHELLKEGATPILSSKDILAALGFLKDESEEELDIKKEFANEIVKEYSPEEALILRHLTEPLQRDQLIQKTRFEATELNSLLSLLEIKGLIKEAGGEFFLQ